VPQSLGVFRFGDFSLDRRERRLLRGGQDLYLPPKTFELLVFLVQNRGRVIAKDELLEAIWPGVNVVENTLAQRIREIREALGDDRNGARLIKTIPRVGYQFVGRVEERDPLGRTGSAAEPDTAGRTPAVWRYRWLFGLVAVLTILVFLVRSRVNAPRLLSNHQLVSGFPASLRDPSLSPDGGTMAFVEDVDGQAQIWLKSLSGGEATQLTHVNGAGLSRTHWSRNGDQILFNYSGGIWSVSPLGSTARRIVERGRNPSLSADGKQLAYEGLGVPDGDRGIWIANVDGTNRRRLTEKAYDLAAGPALSPDGRMVVFFESDGGPMGDFWVVSTTGGVPRRLTFDDTEAGAPTWTSDGRFIIFSSERAGSRMLWRISASGGNPEPLTSGAGEDSDPLVSADGRRLIYTNTRNSFSLETLDLRTGRKQTVVQRRTLISGPRFSPGGNRIALFHRIQSGVHVFSIASDGTDLRQITSGRGERNIVPRWSAQGDALFFSQVRPADSLRKIAASGGQSTEVFPWAWTARVEMAEHGRAIVFARDQQFIVRRLDSGVETILDRPLNNARWSRDGQTVFGTQTVRAGNFNTWNVVGCSAATGSCRTITRGHGVVPSPDGQRLYFMRPGTSGMRELWSLNVEGNDERSHGHIGPFRLPDVVFDVSREHMIVWPAFHAGKPEIWMAAMQ